MRVVVVEIRNNKAALLSEDGCIVKMRNDNYEIGQEVEMGMKSKVSFKRTAIAAAVGLMLTVGIGTAAYSTPVDYVCLDLNPSIEYKVNMFDRVVAVEGVNDDGKEILSGIQERNLKHKNIKECIALTVDALAHKGYLKGELNDIVISTTKDKEASELETEVDEACKRNECNAEVQVVGIGKARVDRADDLGITPGKLNLIEKLNDSKGNEELTDEFIKEWQDRPVKEIMKEIKENRKEDKGQRQEKTNQNNGNNKGNGNSNGKGNSGNNGNKKNKGNN